MHFQPLSVFRKEAFYMEKKGALYAIVLEDVHKVYGSKQKAEALKGIDLHGEQRRLQTVVKIIDKCSHK